MEATPARRGDAERRLSPRDVEEVLGRAIELHVRDAAAGSDELSEAELLRIGHELGLPATSVRRALAEVDGGLRPEEGWIARHVGPRRTGSSRIVGRSSADVERELEAYLLEVEGMVVERRFPARTVYVRAKGVLAWSLRTAGKLGRRHSTLDAERLEVGVQPLDGGSCCVAVALDLERTRREHTAVGAVAGAVGGLGGAALAATLVAPPLAVVGVPLAAAGLYGSRVAYRGALLGAVARVESLLDRLEHRELRRSPARALRVLGL